MTVDDFFGLYNESIAPRKTAEFYTPYGMQRVKNIFVAIDLTIGEAFSVNFEMEGGCSIHFRLDVQNELNDMRKWLKGEGNEAL